MAKFIEVEVYVMVDSEGNYVAHENGAELSATYEDRVQPVADAEGFRVVKLTVKVPLPTVIELKGEVAADEEAGELKAV